MREHPLVPSHEQASDDDLSLDAPLGPLLGEGAEASIHVVDDRRVIRVTKSGRSLRSEADVLRFARRAGYPAPAVHGISRDGSRLLLERVDGPSLLDAVLAGSVRGPDAGRLLGDLHRRLHLITAPSWLPQRGDGTALLHLDLHPANVLVGSDGPVVIDWPNAAAGPAGLDVADAYLVMASYPVPPGELARLRDEVLAAFLGSCGEPDPSPWYAEVLDRRSRDPHFTAEQLTLMRSAVEAQS